MRLDRQAFDGAVEELAARDGRLAAVLERWGPPPFWVREPGFATLIHLILEQQVSLASAKATYDRLLARLDSLEPARFRALDDETLRDCGFSRQKIRYGRALAEALLDGRLELDRLAGLDDESVRRRLVALPGIGRWTADVYLLMALRRSDIWPVGDIALRTAAGELLELDGRPTSAELEPLGEPWRPWRAVASRFLWHDYLCRRGRSQPLGVE